VAAIVWADVEALQANLSTVSVEAQTVILEHVNEDLNPDAFGGEDVARYHLARCYLAAHLGELTRRNGAQNASSKTIGTSSITLAYAQAQAPGDALMQTSWGSQYAAMVRSSPLRIGGGRCR
jgi:hypothetical protein